MTCRMSRLGGNDIRQHMTNSSDYHWYRCRDVQHWEVACEDRENLQEREDRRLGDMIPDWAN